MTRATYPRTIYTLLCMLSMQPMSGYDIKQALKHMVHNFWSESDGQIYPGLKRCLEENLAESHDTPPSQASQTYKKMYHITDQGRHTLSLWLQNDAFKSTQRDEGLLKLTFCDDEHAHVATRIIEDRLSNAIAQLEKLKQSQLSEALPKEHTSLPYWPHVRAYHQSMLEAEIHWAETIIHAEHAKI